MRFIPISVAFLGLSVNFFQMILGSGDVILSGNFGVMAGGGFSELGRGHFASLNPCVFIAVSERTSGGWRRGSEWQGLLPIARRARLAEFGRTAGSLHGEDQDQKGLVEMTVMKLGCLSEDIRDDVISDLQFLQDGRFQFHKQGMKGLMLSEVRGFRAGEACL